LTVSDHAGRTPPNPDVAEPPPQLSVVIPCYNSEATLADQLSAIARQVTRYTWEVLIADNGSRDRTLAIAESFRLRISTLRIVDATQSRGAAYARNAGANAALGRGILFCDADDEMGEGYIEAMGLALERDRFVACRYDFSKLNRSWLAAARGNVKDGQSNGLAGGYCHPTLPYAGAGGLGIANAVHHAVNGFDMTLKAMAGQEDTDYCIRVQLSGTPLVFVPDAVMHVRFRDTVPGVFRQAWAWAESGAHVQRRYAPVVAPESFRRLAYDLTRHLAWKLIRVRTPTDLAQWIWLAGWCGGLLNARWTLERVRE
jgi:glycosyltransferase involved in cell wall biosynthesis